MAKFMSSVQVIVGEKKRSSEPDHEVNATVPNDRNAVSRMSRTDPDGF